MDTLLLGGAGLVAVLVILLIAYIVFRRSYRVAAPNEALIITGGKQRSRGGDVGLDEGSRVVVGGRAFVRPLFDRAHTLSLSSRQILVEIEALSSNDIPLKLRGVAQIKIGERTTDVRKAAQRFLDQQDDIDSYSQEVLSGTMRSAVGTLTVETILRDRKSFAEKVQEDALDSMNNQGLVIDTFQITSIADDGGSYLEDLGKPEAAAAAKRAAIAESEATRQATEARNADQEAIAESQKALELRQAAIQRETAREKAEAEAAEDLARAQQEQRILEEKQKIAEQQNELRERELVAEIRKPADAKKYEVERQADAQRYQAGQKADAQRYAREQDSEAALAEEKNRAAAVEAAGRAEAASVRARGEAEAETAAAKGRAEAESAAALGRAEAESTAARGRAEAESIEAAAEAYAKYNDAAVLSQILEALPKVAHEVAAPYGNIENLSVVSSDGESKLSKNVAVGMQETLRMVQSTTGLDLGEFLQKAMASRTEAGGGSTGRSGTTGGTGTGRSGSTTAPPPCHAAARRGGGAAS
ncbi:SPFH domain-containing protein [Brevibacterium sp.]|uniref:flotillin family protein n=1 Tax=Brevibacterium sp. TaxID=1701 RepID=UPI0025BCA877|nr:SPFH domain-containing protein [Brevibacterium sp.]